jgi:N-acetylmuramoyl-L-alanine amidase
MYHSAGLYSALHSYSRLSKDLEEAIRLYRRLAEDYRDHRLADDAQYLIGEIYYERKQDPAQAYVEFLKVDIKFPKGDMRPKAKKMLDQLSVKLSKAGDGMGKKKGPIPRARRFAVKDIRHWSTPNYTRVVIDVEGPITYQHNLLQADPDHKKPRRIYFDLNGAYVSDRIDRPKLIDDGLLRRARAAQYQHDIVRVVLDMESVGRYEAFHLHDPFRIVVDVRRLEGKGVESGPQVAEKEDPAGKKARRDETKKGKDSLAKQLGLNVRRIVLDPGHGGKDPGCASSKRVREKTIVLKIAKYLAKKIRKEIGCEVLLTRAGDTYLGLEQRTAIANMKKADLFVSLHINAHKDRHIHGIETYFLNLATDERAVLVAARENATSEKNISDLQTILNDLMLNTKIHESSRLAQEVQKGMVSRLKKSYGNVRDLGVKQAPFYVLIGAQMPAILVETGFITNSMERKRLLSGKYQERVAEGICAGIKRYIKSIDKVYTGG